MSSRTTAGRPSNSNPRELQEVRPLLLSPEEAARLLSIGRTQVFALLSTGDLESVRVGRLRRIPFDACVAFVEQLRRASSSVY